MKLSKLTAAIAVAAVAESAVSNDEEGVPVEAISEDAAKLPESGGQY